MVNSQFSLILKSALVLLCWINSLTLCLVEKLCWFQTFKKETCLLSRDNTGNFSATSVFYVTALTECHFRAPTFISIYWLINSAGSQMSGKRHVFLTILKKQHTQTSGTDSMLSPKIYSYPLLILFVPHCLFVQRSCIIILWHMCVLNAFIEHF